MTWRWVNNDSFNLLKELGEHCSRTHHTKYTTIQKVLPVLCLPRIHILIKHFINVKLLGCFPNLAALCLMSWRTQKSFNVSYQYGRRREEGSEIEPEAWAYRTSRLSPVRSAGAARPLRRDRIFIPPRAMLSSTAVPCSCWPSARRSLSTSISNPWQPGSTRMEAGSWRGE